MSILNNNYSLNSNNNNNHQQHYYSYQQQQQQQTIPSVFIGLPSNGFPKYPKLIPIMSSISNQTKPIDAAPVKSEISNNSSNNNNNNNIENSVPNNMSRHVTQLSTSSPAGLAAAAAVTPDKLAHLLINEGPLAIRHLTSHLASIIPGFSQLSLSKQRRLIMAALDAGDPESGCIFEKVGWGQWSTKFIGKEAVLARRQIIQSQATKNEQENESLSRSNSSSSPPKNVISNLKKQNSPPTKKTSETINRRESITNPANDPHSTKLPAVSPRTSFAGVSRPTSHLMKISTSNEDAILSSSDEEEDHNNSNNVFSDDDEEEDEEVEDGLNNKFQYHVIKPITSVQPRSNSQVIYSTSPLISGSNNVPYIRHSRGSFSSSKGISKPKVRSRLGSFNSSSPPSNLEDPGDNIEELQKFRNSRGSFNESFVRKSSNSPKRISISSLTNATNSPPISSPIVQEKIIIDDKIQSRTLNSSSNSPSYHSDTDEEDWNNPETLNKMVNADISRPSIQDNEEKIKRKNLDFREEAAVYALVNLSSV